MRIEELKKSMLEIGIDHLLISDTKLIEYVLGKRFYVGERFIGLLVQEDKPILFLNLLFPYQNTEIEIVRFHDIDDPIRMLTERLDGIDLAIDRNLASGFLLRLLKHKPGLRVIDGSFAIDRIRAKKSPDELELLREASRINDKIMAEVRQQLREGVSEIEIADFITQRFNEVADGVSFLPIVAFGDHTADPHAECSNRKLEVGMPVIIDMGCVKDGYCSDMTRSFSFQKAWNSEIYELVTKANLAGIASVKPGVRLSDIDTAARRVIEAAGYGVFVDVIIYDSISENKFQDEFYRTIMKLLMLPMVLLDNLGINPLLLKRSAIAISNHYSAMNQHSKLMSQEIIIPWEKFMREPVFKKSDIYPFRLYPFEGREYYSYNNLETILHQWYGANCLRRWEADKWVETLPFEKRKPKHTVDLNLNGNFPKK